MVRAIRREARRAERVRDIGRRVAHQHALIAIGGEDTLGVATTLTEHGFHVVGEWIDSAAVEAAAQKAGDCKLLVCDGQGKATSLADRSARDVVDVYALSLIHISEPTRPY